MLNICYNAMSYKIRAFLSMHMTSGGAIWMSEYFLTFLQKNENSLLCT